MGAPGEEALREMAAAQGFELCRVDSWPDAWALIPKWGCSPYSLMPYSALLPVLSGDRAAQLRFTPALLAGRRAAA